MAAALLRGEGGRTVPGANAARNVLDEFKSPLWAESHTEETNLYTNEIDSLSRLDRF
jgi:hypothetical protein